jgi:hypothetical protein
MFSLVHNNVKWNLLRLALVQNVNRCRSSAIFLYQTTRRQTSPIINLRPPWQPKMSYFFLQVPDWNQVVLWISYTHAYYCPSHVHVHNVHVYIVRHKLVTWETLKKSWHLIKYKCFDSEGKMPETGIFNTANVRWKWKFELTDVMDFFHFMFWNTRHCFKERFGSRLQAYFFQKKKTATTCWLFTQQLNTD